MIGSLIKSFLWLSEPFLITFLVYILGFSWRIKFKGLHLLKQHNYKVLYIFWHENMLPPLFTHRNRQVGVLVSPSRDGERISKVLKLLGFKVFRGDTQKRGGSALIELVNYGKKEHEIAITPDGPKGPRREAKRGIFLIAKRTKLPILTVKIKASKCFRFSSWDKFMLPYPFSKIEIVVKNPGRDLTREKLERLLS